MQKTNFKEFYKKNSNRITIILWVVFILWKIPFLNKGIDYTDTGFSMENYENVFFGNGIESIGVFLTTLIGGLIYKLLPAYHLLVYRVLHWLFGLITAFFAYKLFKRYLDKNLILVLLLGLALVTKGGEAMFSYYPVTACLLMASLLLLHNGLVDSKKSKMLFAGLLSGINVFVRLPNVLFLAMALGIIYYGWIQKYTKKDVFKLVLYYALGVLIALLCIAPIICLVMGSEGLIESLMGYVRLALGQTQDTVENVLGIQEKSGHSLTAIIKTLCLQCAKTVVSVVVFVAPAVIIVQLANLILKRLCKKDNCFVMKYKKIILALFFITVAFLIKDKISATIFLVIGLGSLFLSLILLIKLHKKNPEIEFLLFTNLIMGCCSVFGSDLGFNRLGILGNFIILTAYISVKYLVKIEQSSKYIKIAGKKCLSLAFMFVIISAYIVGVFCKLPAAYCDSEYSELKYSVDSQIKIFRGMKTSEKRVSQLEEYYEVMSKRELQSYETAIFGYFPLGFTIGSQSNYFEDIQPCIDYPSVSVESLLKVINEKREKDIKPLIVVSYVNQIQRGDDHFTSDAKMAVLEYMLEQYEYEIYYESENFIVYKPVE